MILYQSKTGKQLYDLLPEIYRTKDNGDLAGYLDTLGGLADRINATLDQRLADSFPDNSGGNRDCQPWLLPYFAQLFDIRLSSPFAQGRRDEVANGIFWRKQKGTLGCIRDITQSVGRMTTRIQEGYKRVAVTPRAGDPVDTKSVAVDFRNLCPDVEPGQFRDDSKRTVDFRTPDTRQGHFHPGRILLFVPFPSGFFPEERYAVDWHIIEQAVSRGEETLIDDRVRIGFENDTCRIENTTTGPIEITSAGRVELDNGRWRFDNIIFSKDIRLVDGQLELVRAAVPKVVISTGDVNEPVLIATDSLFNDIRTARGLSRLVRCTVLKKTVAEAVQSVESIFMGDIIKDYEHDTPPAFGCIRFSRIPPALRRLPDCTGLILDLCTNTDKAPQFFSTRFGEPGCGVLSPQSPEQIRFGAENNGEMGCYHHLFLCRRHDAILEKLKDYLPVGMEAVMIYDQTIKEKGCENSDITA